MRWTHLSCALKEIADKSGEKVLTMDAEHDKAYYHL